MRVVIEGKIDSFVCKGLDKGMVIEGDFEASDSYHTFSEIYAHRIMLFIALMKSYKDISWKSRLHDDGSSYDGWFIGGMNLPSGVITYHIPDSYWSILDDINTIEKSLYDGHTADDVLKRLNNFVFAIGKSE